MKVLDRSLDEVQDRPAWTDWRARSSCCWCRPERERPTPRRRRYCYGWHRPPAASCSWSPRTPTRRWTSSPNGCASPCPASERLPRNTGFRDNPVSIFRIRDGAPRRRRSRPRTPAHQDHTGPERRRGVRVGERDPEAGQELDKSGWLPGYRRATGLIVDKASMMLFPDFLALGTMVSPDGEMMLAGDHMQLSPITSHDWENETREQMVRMTAARERVHHG